jgi:hypothetical protein
MTQETVPVIIWLVVKILTLLGIMVYGVFAGVMVRQEHLMSNVLEEEFEPVLRLLTYIHLFVVVGVFLLAVVLL